VHRGFQLALNQVWEKVHSVVTAYRQKNRQRGDLFYLAIAWGPRSPFLRSAGSPILIYRSIRSDALAWVTEHFAIVFLSNRGKGIYRYVNYNDAVAHVPTESLLYRHTPEKCYRFAENGDLDTDDSSFKGDIESLRLAIVGLPSSIKGGCLDEIPAPPSLVDHSPARYAFRPVDCV